MKELKMEELSVRQKVGMAMVGIIIKDDRWEGFEENLEYTLNLIRNHSLGAVWVSPRLRNLKQVMEAIKEAADYPILIFTDAESGIGEYMIGRHNAIGCTGSEEHAYTFGKVTAVAARQMGYNVVCNPVLDMINGHAVCGGNVRSFGSDKYKVAQLAAAEAQGMHDGGLLTVGKHYPSATNYARQIDSHMAETASLNTVEELLDYNLYPYLELMKKGLLDGIMVGHARLAKIDPDFPGSLSKKVIDIIRNQGFNGFTITDSLQMMGIVSKFGASDSKGLAIAAGNDLALPWEETGNCYEALCDCYDKGIISNERLDEAVGRVLEAQRKTLMVPKYTDITEEDVEKFNSINRDSIFARTDEGLPTAISHDGRHYFVVMVENGTAISDAGKVTIDTFSTPWYNPQKIMRKLEELFPNSAVTAIDQFPSPAQNMKMLERSVDYDDVVFITFVEGKAYSGMERFTSRITSLVEALQVTNRVSTIVHFGSPYALEDFEDHIPRIIIGGLSADSVNYTLDVLAGKYPAKGVLTYDVKLK